jgi:NADH-quinone oxidoreductase subunit J
MFCAAALVGGVLMLLLRHPMRVALALVATMLSLAGVYALLAVHVIAVFQVLIYVGAVMVFMVYVIMLLDVREPGTIQRFSGLLLPGIVAGALFAALMAALVLRPDAPAQIAADASAFGVQRFSIAFLREYWLYFELSSVLLVVAVIAAVAVIRERGGRDD